MGSAALTASPTGREEPVGADRGRGRSLGEDALGLGRPGLPPHPGPSPRGPRVQRVLRPWPRAPTACELTSLPGGVACRGGPGRAQPASSPQPSAQPRPTRTSVDAATAGLSLLGMCPLQMVLSRHRSRNRRRERPG